MRYRLLIAEAVICLLAARLVIRLLPFRSLERIFTRPVLQVPQPSPDDVIRVRSAIASAVRHSPISFVCFPQAVAAQDMLRRRGLATTLHYGAASGASPLAAHVWLSRGDTGIVGHRVAAGFLDLARYTNS